MFSLESVQAALRQFQLDGWLLCDFRGRNVLAGRVLGLTAGHSTRRWFYWIPAEGSPQKLVHRIESGALDRLPGEKRVYLRWQELEAGLAAMLPSGGRVAMEYSPRNSIPYVAQVDAGTVELVRSLGAEVVSSGDLIQAFEAVWDEAAWQSHLAASQRVLAAFEHGWAYIADQVRSRGQVRESEVQDELMRFFDQQGLVTDHPPIVAAGPHSGDPHYAPQPGSDAAIVPGSFVLLDIWGKLREPGAVFADYTRVGYLGDEPPETIRRVFEIVAAARDAAVECVRQAFAAGETLCGWQVDRAAREVIEQAGYGEAFIHRTGHSIGQETHGNGANMDDLETHDERQVLPGTCFSIEPGIYLDDFGIRSEVNVYVAPAGNVHVTGNPQTQIQSVPL